MTFEDIRLTRLQLGQRRGGAKSVCLRLRRVRCFRGQSEFWMLGPISNPPRKQADLQMVRIRETSAHHWSMVEHGGKMFTHCGNRFPFELDSACFGGPRVSGLPL